MRATRHQWDSAGLWTPYWGVEFDKRAGDKQAYAAVESYVEDITASLATGKGLLLTGEPGTGKTLLAHLVADAALEAGRRVSLLSVANYQALITRQMDLMTLVEKVRDTDAAEEWKRIDKKLRRLRTDKVNLLVLDDMGKEHRTGSGWAEHVLERLIRVRGNHGLPMVITTNLGPDEWAPSWGESLASFLHQVCSIINVVGDDFRERDE